MTTSKIVPGGHYKNALGAVYFVDDIVKVANRYRVRWLLVYSTKTASNASANAPKVGDRGEQDLSRFAARMTSGTTRRCKVCRCTQERACDGGCSWLSYNLCSADTESHQAERVKQGLDKAA